MMLEGARDIVTRYIDKRKIFWIKRESRNGKSKNLASKTEVPKKSGKDFISGRIRYRNEHRMISPLRKQWNRYHQKLEMIEL